MGSLVVDGALNFGGLPGFDLSTGNLDLGSLGLSLSDLDLLGFDFGGLLDGLNLDLGKLPGFDLGLGSLDLGKFALPGMITLNKSWTYF